MQHRRRTRSPSLEVDVSGEKTKAARRFGGAPFSHLAGAQDDYPAARGRREAPAVVYVGYGDRCFTGRHRYPVQAADRVDGGVEPCTPSYERRRRLPFAVAIFATCERLAAQADAIYL
ncbi:hypothetical protein [Phenylobacterium sp.]|uniref:hypothetical protein n=1 Tax=Phenylobacterium sp. TaxID=1871053 RepID=UPI002F41E611